MDSDYPFDIFKPLYIVLYVLLRLMDSDYPFDIFKPLYIVLYVLLRLMDYDYPFDIFKLFLLDIGIFEIYSSLIIIF